MNRNYSAMTMKFFNISAEEKLAGTCRTTWNRTNTAAEGGTTGCFSAPANALGTFDGVCMTVVPGTFSIS